MNFFIPISIIEVYKVEKHTLISNMEFIYLTDTVMEHQQWYPGEPKGRGDCVVLQKYTEGYYWRDANCNEKHAFICVKGTA